MKAVLITLGIILTVLILGGVGVFTTYIGYYDQANAIEKNIDASWEQSKNVRSQYALKIKEMAGVSDMYTEDLTKVYTAAITGRYGSDGSKAMMQWIQEHNPNFDSALYTKLQNTMEAGRDKFENSQKRVIELKRTYETMLDSFWPRFYLGFGGFPKINLDDYKVIMSQDAAQTFETGVDEGIKLR